MCLALCQTNMSMLALTPMSSISGQPGKTRCMGHYTLQRLPNPICDTGGRKNLAFPSIIPVPDDFGLILFSYLFYFCNVNTYRSMTGCLLICLCVYSRVNHPQRTYLNKHLTTRSFDPSYSLDKTFLKVHIIVL